MAYVLTAKFNEYIIRDIHDKRMEISVFTTTGEET